MAVNASEVVFQESPKVFKPPSSVLQDKILSPFRKTGYPFQETGYPFRKTNDDRFFFDFWRFLVGIQKSKGMMSFIICPSFDVRQKTKIETITLLSL